jgi:FdhE protein
MAEVVIVRADIPSWNEYTDDFHSGVPLLHSSAITVDLESVGASLVALAQGLSLRALPGSLAEECRAFHSELLSTPDAPRHALHRLLDKGITVSEPQALLQYLGWSVLARYLHPVVGAFNCWRDEERWLRNYCPTCGASPAMAQLAGTEPGRLRMLSCGRCETRWRYRRTACPFCENIDNHKLAVLAVEGQSGLRIDYCEECRGYIKTYNGEGSERILLADWTSIHLDVVARDRGLKRFARSFYDL